MSEELNDEVCVEVLLKCLEAYQVPLLLPLWVLRALEGDFSEE